MEKHNSIHAVVPSPCSRLLERNPKKETDRQQRAQNSCSLQIAATVNRMVVQTVSGVKSHPRLSPAHPALYGMLGLSHYHRFARPTV